jgi:hypothetical protein
MRKPLCPDWAAFSFIRRVSRFKHSQTMYDLTVEEVYTFAVGEGAWVVHNCDGTITTPSNRRVARPLTLSDGTVVTENQTVTQSEAVRIQDAWVGENAWSDGEFLYSADPSQQLDLFIEQDEITTILHPI